TILRSQVFRVNFGTPDQRVREALLAAAAQVKNVRLDPRPVVLATESTESGISYKLVYAIEDYGTQWSTADQVITAAIKELEAADIQFAVARLHLTRQSPVIRA